MTGVIETRLAALGLELPEASAPAFNYLAVAVHGGLAYVSGQIPRGAGGAPVVGKLGATLDLAAGQAAARCCVLHALAQLQACLGGLDRVERVLKVTGFVASAPGFNDQPLILDAASGLLIEVFGEPGRHARSAVGVAELPRGVPVEVEMVVALRA